MFNVIIIYEHLFHDIQFNRNHFVFFFEFLRKMSSIWIFVFFLLFLLFSFSSSVIVFFINIVFLFRAFCLCTYQLWYTNELFNQTRDSFDHRLIKLWSQFFSLLLLLLFQVCMFFLLHSKIVLITLISHNNNFSMFLW